VTGGEKRNTENAMKKLLIFTTVLASAVAANAIIYTTNFTVGTAVPDNNYSGWVNSQTIAGQSGTIANGSLLVSLELTDGWNGDLYAYLVHDTGFAVLLDRVGYTESGYGFGTAGMDVWLTDAAGQGSIETIASPLATGTYSRSDYAGSLSSFDGLNPNGTWSLFVADLNGGGVSTVQSWGLQMDIVAVPEVEAWIAAALAAAFGAFWVNRQVWQGVKSRA
jgi:subtilisin-like proprotein convertase family protein